MDPKQFYRKMERMLARIAGESHDDDFLPLILENLVSSFGEQLRFGNGHMYRELFGAYELLHTSGSTDLFPARISVTDPAAQQIYKHGAFLFEMPEELPDWYKPQEDDAPQFVAFRVEGAPGYQYLFMFSLKEGWQRAELAFCLNGVRFSLNTRLKSEAAQSELETAAAIQRSLLPQRPPEFDGFDIAVRSKPAEAVGGDLYDFIELENELLGIAMGDASGHGMPAALLVRDVLMGIRMGVGTNLKMLYAMKKLNRVIHKTTLSTRFVSVFYCELARSGGILFTNAGHTSGLIISGDDYSTIHRMDPTGPIMGPLPDIPLERDYAEIPPGGILVLYTDGITERTEKDGSIFEEEGLIRLVQKHADRSAATIVNEVFEYSLSLDHQSDLFEDDSTLMIIKRSA